MLAPQAGPSTVGCTFFVTLTLNNSLGLQPVLLEYAEHRLASLVFGTLKQLADLAVGARLAYVEFAATLNSLLEQQSALGAKTWSPASTKNKKSAYSGLLFVQCSGIPFFFASMCTPNSPGWANSRLDTIGGCCISVTMGIQSWYGWMKSPKIQRRRDTHPFCVAVFQSPTCPISGSAWKSEDTSLLAKTKPIHHCHHL